MKIWRKYLLLCLTVLLIFFAFRNTLFNANKSVNFPKENNKARTTIFLHQEAAQSEELESYDCMQELFQTKWRGSTNNKLSSKHCDLCKIFHGRYYNATRQCKYYHPNTVHYIKFSGDKKPLVTFRDYVSMFSVDRFYKPDKIIIHADNVNLTGSFWDRLLVTITTPIEVRPTERFQEIDGKKPGWIHHEADYIKLKLALREGGMYIDFDVILLNGTKFHQLQEKSEFVIGGGSDTSDSNCTKINAGFFSSVPNSSFVRNWLDKSYESGAYQPLEWDYNCGDVPSELLCKCPRCYDVYISSELSNWRDSKSKRWLKPGQVEWRERPGVHYMNVGFMKPFIPRNELFKMDTPFTDMLKYVLGDSYKDFL